MPDSDDDEDLDEWKVTMTPSSRHSKKVPWPCVEMKLLGLNGSLIGTDYSSSEAVIISDSLLAKR